MMNDYSLTCVCGRLFAQPGALAYHHCSCKKTKVRLAVALKTVKDAWTNRKRHQFKAIQAEHKYSSPQDATSESTMEVHEANTMDAEVHIFYLEAFMADLKSQVIMQPLDKNLAFQPGPIIDSTEVLCCYIGIYLILLNEIFRKLPHLLQSVDHIS
jgi:hypothetical protein